MTLTFWVLRKAFINSKILSRLQNTIVCAAAKTKYEGFDYSNERCYWAKQIYNLSKYYTVSFKKLKKKKEKRIVLGLIKASSKACFYWQFFLLQQEN